MKQFLKKGKAEGSVLFTVVAVMLVMVVFLMSTMVLTTSAHRRSYYTFNETQAQYAAQAAIDAVTNSAYTDAGFYNWVKANAGVGANVTVSFNGSGINFTGGNQAVVCSIEPSDNLMVWDDMTRAVHPQTAYKLTATASVGNGRNRSEYTVCNYIYENYRVDDPDLLPSVDNSAINNVHNWTRGPSVTRDIDSGSINRAVFSLGPTTSGNNMSYFGPQSLGMMTIPDGRLNYTGSGHDIEKTNDNYAVGEIFAVGNYKLCNSYGLHFTFEKFGESAQFYGDLVNTGAAKGSVQGVHFTAMMSDEEVAKYGLIGYTQLPYVYVDGCIMSTSGGGMYFGHAHDLGNPRSDEYYNVNVYCGGIKTYGDAGSEFTVAGDAYLYDPALDSDIDGMQSQSTLTKFASANVNRANTQWDDMSVGGNLICNNKSLTLNSNAKGMTIQGDLIMTNPSGELIIANPITVNGKVLVAGTISADSLAKINCNTIVTTTSAKVNGAAVDTDDYFSYLYSNYGDGAYDERLGDGYADYISNPNSMALMPFSMRLDEIFDQYLRWDLKSYDINIAAENAANDPLIAESIATGHSWQDANGAWQMKEFIADEPVRIATRFETQNQLVEKYDQDAGVYVSWDFNGAIASGKIAEYEQNAVGVDGETHWALIRYYDEVQVPVEWTEYSGTVYVPYTNATTDNHFITHFEPITNQASVKAMVSDSYYIDDITQFTAGMTGAPTLTMGSGTHRDVNVIYHDNTQSSTPVVTKALNDALIVEESCYLDITNMGGGNVFINPNAKNYSDSNPLRVVLSGSSNTGGTIVINNTGIYSPDYSNQSINPTPATRKQVYIFFEDGFAANTSPGLRILMSGAYAQATAVSNQVGELHVVSNPLRPDQDGFDDLPYDIKYAYELVPNALVFGQNGCTYDFNNGGIINAEVLMPTAKMNVHNSSNYAAHIYYQEETYSAVYSSDSTVQGSGGLPCFGLGSMICLDLNTAPNTASVIYIGDTKGQFTESEEDTVQTDLTKRSDKLGNEDIDYFNNDHLGAS